MSLNQIINPVVPLNASFNTVECNSFVDSRQSVQYNIPSVSAGIVANTGYTGTFNANSFVRRFNDPVSGAVCTEVLLQFTAPLNVSASGTYSFIYAIPAGSSLGYCDAGLYKPALSTGQMPGVGTIISGTALQVEFNYGASQPQALSSITKMHLLLVQTPA